LDEVLNDSKLEESDEDKLSDSDMEEKYNVEIYMMNECEEGQYQNFIYLNCYEFFY
jgi:hypothetical protein